MNKLTVLAIAAVVALVSAVGLVRYVGGAEHRATASADLVPVLTAAADVPEGTPFADAWAAGQIVRSETLMSIRPSTAVLDPAALVGTVAYGVVRQGQIVVDGEFPELRAPQGPADVRDQPP